MDRSALGRGPDVERGREPAGGVSLEAVFRQMQSGVVVAEAPHGRLVQVNPHAERIWRRSFAGVEGIADYGIWRGIHPDGRPYEPGEWPLARSLATGEVVDGEEVAILRGDDSRGVVRVCSCPLRDAEGRIVAAVLTCTDVTEQTRREGMRRLLAETSAALASSLDYPRTLRNVARLVVPALADWCGIDMVAEGEGVERLAVEPPPPAAGPGAASPAPPPPSAGDAGVRRVLRSGTAELLPELDEPLLRGLVGEGEPLRRLRALRPSSAMIVPLVARGKILGTIVLVGGASRRRYGAEELEQVKELAVRAALAIDNARLYHDAQAANRAKADFLAVVSHELRTPLTAIIGYAELLSLGVPEPVTDRQKEQVERIEVSARHLLQLIEEILTMASLETGRSTVRREPVELGALLERAAMIVEPLVAAKGLEMRREPVAEDLAVESDPDKLLQVVLNLLSNAVKFTEEGGISLGAARVGDHLELRVHDSGVGVRPADRERIFDPFWQAEHPVTRRAGGTGLGLAISRRLAELLGGELRAEAREGGGSTFVLRVPYSRST